MLPFHFESRVTELLPHRKLEQFSAQVFNDSTRGTWTCSCAIVSGGGFLDFNKGTNSNFSTTIFFEQRYFLEKSALCFFFHYQDCMLNLGY